MSSDKPDASVIIVLYNSAAFVRTCLASIIADASAPKEIIVVDNASTDVGRALVEREFPTVRLIALPQNLGFGAACNVGAAAAQGRYLAFVNPDTVVEPGWLAALIAALDADPTIGAVSPKLTLWDQPQTINACGLDIHFVGFGSCHFFGRPASQVRTMGDIGAISGAAFVMSRTLYQRLGGLDPHFFLYVEDTDLSWRLRLAGYRCCYVPQAVVRHHFPPGFPAQKFFYLERNRYWLLLKNLDGAALLALLPGLCVAEACSWGYALLRGWSYVRAKWSAHRWLVQQWSALHQARAKAILNRHAITMSALVRSGSVRIAYDVAYPGLLARWAGVVCDPLYAGCRWFALTALSGWERTSGADARLAPVGVEALHASPEEPAHAAWSASPSSS